MAYIDKLLNKFNKVQNSINSLKGISAKIQSLNYNTEIDKLGELKEGALKNLADRNQALKSLNDLNKQLSKKVQKENPNVHQVELKYPYEEELTNYIIFDIRKRPMDRTLSGDNTPEPNSIALYVPDTLTSDANVSFGDVNVGPIRKAAVNIIDALMSPQNDVSNVGGQQVQNLMQTGATSLANMVTGGISNMRAGIATNPQKEVTLNPLEFRTFSFDYEFNPRSKEEAEQVRQIIYTFRTSMLPDAVDFSKLLEEDEELVDDSSLKNNAFYSFPNIFDIYFDGPVADKIDGFLPAVCTSAQINYTGGQKFATLYDGQPVKVTLSLSFQEIRVLTRTNYKEISAIDNKNVFEANIIKDNQDSIVGKANVREELQKVGINFKTKPKNTGDGD